MPITTAKAFGDYPVKSSRLETYFWSVKLDTAGASAPDGVDPSISDVTISHTGGGDDILVTFAEKYKPNDVLWAHAEPVNVVNYRVAFISYTVATGVLKFSVAKEDGVSGIHAVENDKDNLEVRILALCTRSDKS